MTIRHQRGHLRCTKRKNGPSAWEFLWRENDASGKRLRRTAVIGSLEQYPTEDLALAVVQRTQSEHKRGLQSPALTSHSGWRFDRPL
jgi:hypothetical protein